MNQEEYTIATEVRRWTPAPLTVQVAQRGDMMHVRLCDPRDQREAVMSMTLDNALSVTLIRAATMQSIARVWGNA